MDLEMIREKAVPILRKNGVAKAAVFGSYARGSQDEGSDIDILIEYAPGAKRSLLVRVGIMDELEEALQKKVHVVTEASLSKFFRKDVLREKLVIP